MFKNPTLKEKINYGRPKSEDSEKNLWFCSFYLQFWNLAKVVKMPAITYLAKNVSLRKDIKSRNTTKRRNRKVDELNMWKLRFFNRNTSSNKP